MEAPAFSAGKPLSTCSAKADKCASPVGLRRLPAGESSHDLDKEFGGSYHSEYLFEVELTIRDGIATNVDILKEEIG